MRDGEKPVDGKDSGTPRPTTLLDLVWRVGRETGDEGLTIRKVSGMLSSGRVRLTGNFRGVPVAKLLA